MLVESRIIVISRYRHNFLAVRWLHYYGLINNQFQYA